MFFQEAYDGGVQGSHVGILSKVNKSHINNTSLGKLKAFQVEEDKILPEVTLYTIYRRILLNWNGVEEGSQGYIRSFQSNETTLGLGWSVLEESGMLPCA
jgi:hypothetical protein